jgi:rare lipoprotein A (peptidoglycan hydrolase)
MPGFRRDRALLVAVFLTAFSVCAPGTALAAAGTGGAAMPAVLPQVSGGMGYGDPGTYSLVVKPIAVLHRRLVARGTMPGAQRRRVILQRFDQAHGWRNVARTRVHSTGRFKVTWMADRMGRISLRAILAARRGARASSSANAGAAVAPTAKVTVYRAAMATFYGPGFFGQQTACGQTLMPDMHGVAHKKLPCGTLVAVTYADREIVVPVIDRGPFNGDYAWDLTQATADALGFTGIGAGEIGYARVDARPAP